MEITSSLEGRDVLPRHLRWAVSTALPADQVWRVRFLVDGKLRWIDFEEPYSYGGDGGYLVTPWISSGNPLERHEFTAEVVTAGGSTWSATVSARVPDPVPAHVPYGIWGRVPASLLDRPFSDRFGHFSAEMYVSGSGELWIGRTYQRAYAYEVRGSTKTLRILAPIQRAPPGIAFSQQGWRLWGDLCTPAGPFATYTITEVDLGDPYSDGFSLSARKDPCPERRALLEGIWQRID